ISNQNFQFNSEMVPWCAYLGAVLQLVVLLESCGVQAKTSQGSQGHHKGLQVGKGATETKPDKAEREATRCPLDIEVLWTADVDGPVYSTPLIFPFGNYGNKQVIFATLLRAIELLEADGSVPWQWPVELDATVFHASPALHDIDGDGVQEVCVCATDGNIHWLRLGDGPNYLPEYHLKIPPLSLTKDTIATLRHLKMDKDTNISDNTGRHTGIEEGVPYTSELKTQGSRLRADPANG
ncbi:unnamed protein product, partial [Choristocarpus tenellus]